jgi:hypothetical protein
MPWCDWTRRRSVLRQSPSPERSAAKASLNEVIYKFSTTPYIDYSTMIERIDIKSPRLIKCFVDVTQLRHIVCYQVD